MIPCVPSQDLCGVSTPNFGTRRLSDIGEMPRYRAVSSGIHILRGRESATKQMIFGSNAARLYGLKLKAAENTRMPAYSEDRLTKLKGEYELAAREPTNLRYGYVRAG
jgi:uncharacterized protein